MKLYRLRTSLRSSVTVRTERSAGGQLDDMKKKKYWKIICAVLVLAVLCTAAYGAASGDSLISLTYIRNTFIPDAVSRGQGDAEEDLQGTYDKAREDLDSALIETGHAVGGGFLPGEWKEGDTLSLETGAGFTLNAGSAAVAHEGHLIDVTEGRELANGERAADGHRYLVGEDTTATVAVMSGRASILLQGSFTENPSRIDITPFYDVSAGDWFHDSAAYAYQQGLMTGTDANTFSPYGSTTRAMMVSVLHRMAGKPASAAGVQTFADVPAGEWFYESVLWGSGAGVTSGTGDGMFSPAGPLTREQAVTFLYRYDTLVLKQKEVGKPSLGAYQDAAQVSSWAEAAFTWAVQNGIVKSTSADELLLSPAQGCSRAELAAMIQNFSKLA